MSRPKSAFFYFLIFLLLAEFLALVRFPYRDTPLSSEAPRNPYIHSGWPEYLKGGNAGTEPLLVIIGNSQGVGRDIPDPDSIFPSVLKEGLIKKGLALRVENWSVGGLRTTDIELLTAKALQRKPRLIIYVVSYTNIDPPSEVDLEIHASDIHLLAGDPSLWNYLRKTPFFKNASVDQLARRWLFLHSYLLRAQTYFKDRLAVHWPKDRLALLFGPDVKTLEQIDLRKAPAIAPPRPLGIKPRAIEADKAELRARFETFQDLFNRVSAHAAEKGVRLLWVWSPAAVQTVPPEVLQEIERFYDDCGRIIQDSGAGYANLTQSIPEQRFLTYSHLDEEGHRQMAGLLLPEVLDGLQ